MRALFGRKIYDMEELREATEAAKLKGAIGLDYMIIREVNLSDMAFKKFVNDLLADQSWIEKGDGGMNNAKEIKCIRVWNMETKERVLVNPEGYDYPRYTAIEE